MRQDEVSAFPPRLERRTRRRTKGLVRLIVRPVFHELYIMKEVTRLMGVLRIGSLINITTLSFIMHNTV